MKFEVSDTPIVMVWVEFPELDELYDIDQDRYHNIMEKLYDSLVRMDGVMEVDEMNDCFKCELDKVKQVTGTLNAITIPTALLHINEQIDNLEYEYTEYKKDPDEWVENTGDFLTGELKKLNDLKETLTTC